MSYGTNYLGMAMDCPDPWTATYTGILWCWAAIVAGTLVWVAVRGAWIAWKGAFR